MNMDNIPSELKLYGSWCCWRLNEKGKIPFDAATGKNAKSNDKSTFHSFEFVVDKMHQYIGYDSDGKMTGGIGIGLFDGYSAVDIDKCRDASTGILSDMAKDIIHTIASYTEVSPSGTGVRIIFKSDIILDKSRYYIQNAKRGLEIYLSGQTNKFVTITGNVIYPAEIKSVDITPVLDAYMRRNEPKIITFDIENYKSDTKLQNLWNSTAPGSGANESECDLALCSKLAYYLSANENAVNEAFMSSPYYLSKDDEHRRKWENRTDYREATIRKACSNIVQREEAPVVNLFDESALTDTGNAHLFHNRFGEIIRYNVDNNCWMLWNGKYWQTDVFDNIKNYAEVVIEGMKNQAKRMDEPMRTALLRNVKRALSSAGKIAMLKETEHLQGIPVTNSDFNKDDFLLNCESGIIDLRTGNIMEHDKNAMISKIAPFEYSRAKPVRWLKFIDEIFNGDKELMHYVHKLLGYTITGSTKEQCIFILLGEGQNGKSVLLDTINRVLGDYAGTARIDILLDKKMQNQSTEEIARLAGIRNVITSETEIGDKLKESAIKMLTSGIDKIVCRFLYGNSFEYYPNFKLLMMANHKPVIRGTDLGIWRRIKMIPFNVTFNGDRLDKDLPNKLRKELPEILGWLVEGAMLWQQEGLNDPDCIKNMVKEYRSEMDLVEQWISQNCEKRASYLTRGADLFADFCEYVKSNREFQMTQTMFGRALSRNYVKRTQGGQVYYIGLRIKRSHPERDITDDEMPRVKSVRDI